MTGTTALITPLSIFVLCLAMLGCSPTVQTHAPKILLFNGTGSSVNDVAAIESILAKHAYAYDTADSTHLNRMSDAKINAYRLIIIPGGHYINMGNSLDSETLQRVRKAIEQGTNYLGICAGGLLAGKAECNSLNMTSDVKFDFYAVVNQNIHKAVAPISYPEMSAIEHYWEDGPQFTGWGQIVGKYPDDTPAIVQGEFGRGWLILCGVHPEAPQNWRDELNFSTTARVANEYCATLIDAALHRKALPHY